jgi:hypothetical protein
MSVVRDLIFLVFVLGGAVFGSQVPVFVDAYGQRLGGALDELRDGIAGFEDAARNANISFEEYRVRLRENTDAAVQGTGTEIDRQVARAVTLSSQQRDLTDASIWTRPFVVLMRGDTRILSRTWEAWSPTLTLDPRWGLIGLFLAWLIHGSISALVAGPKAPKRRKGGLQS